MRINPSWRFVLHECIAIYPERSLAYNWGNIRSYAGAEATTAENKNQVNLERITLSKQATDNVGLRNKIFFCEVLMVRSVSNVIDMLLHVPTVAPYN